METFFMSVSTIVKVVEDFRLYSTFPPLSVGRYPEVSIHS